MSIRTRYILCRQTDCTLGEWFDHLAQHGNTDQPPALALQDVTALIRNLLFVVEVTPALQGNATVTRLQGEAATILTALEG